MNRVHAGRDVLPCLMAAATDDADETAFEVEHRSSGIAGVERTVDGELATVDADHATEPSGGLRVHARGDARGVSEGDHPLASFDGVLRGQGDGWERLAFRKRFQSDQSEVDVIIEDLSERLASKRTSVRKQDFHAAAGPAADVTGRQDQAVRIDDHTASRRRHPTSKLEPHGGIGTLVHEGDGSRFDDVQIRSLVVTRREGGGFDTMAEECQGDRRDERRRPDEKVGVPRRSGVPRQCRFPQEGRLGRSERVPQKCRPNASPIRRFHRPVFRLARFRATIR